MKKYDWKNEYNPIRRTAKRLLSGEVLTDGRPLIVLLVPRRYGGRNQTRANAGAENRKG